MIVQILRPIRNKYKYKIKIKNNKIMVQFYGALKIHYI